MFLTYMLNILNKNDMPVVVFELQQHQLTQQCGVNLYWLHYQTNCQGSWC